ncbi:MAG: YeeE/YedE family protein [Betaproteobacteria bacterium]|nr:YeeE/YedE family protein [Betaproteobacteria bacterium]MDE2623062.1 YeeE/YedE family protein [Betaproteobacteria bacterium]
MELVLWGFLFGAILQFARLNCFDTIAGMAVLKDFSIAKTISFTIGLGILLFQAEMQLGWVDYHIKSFLLTGVIVGGLIFGVGMALLGYCPGTVAISLGQGRLDALVGVIGGLCGSLVFAALYPVLAPMLGPDLGKISLRHLVHNPELYGMVSTALALLFMGIALALQRLQRQGWRWLYAAVGLALLNALLTASWATGRPMGASSAFPFAAMVLSGMEGAAYWHKIASAGAWELQFLFGALLAGFAFAVSGRRFQISSVPELWARYHGNAPGKRFFWAFVGGFLLLFGARTAGGCTSGHIISGGMQLALSSLAFAGAVFASFLVTGYYFYRVRGRQTLGAVLNIN